MVGAELKIEFKLVFDDISGILPVSFPNKKYGCLMRVAVYTFMKE